MHERCLASPRLVEVVVLSAAVALGHYLVVGTAQIVAVAPAAYSALGAWVLAAVVSARISSSKDERP